MTIALVLIVVYAVVAQRRVYGGSRAVTVAKALCIATVYAVLWAVTSFGVTLWVARG
jgi:type IV secretory pathway TrbD component